MWDQELDCEGLLCPLPVLKARKRLAAMVSGQVLCVRATDAMARIDLPHFCEGAGHAYLEARDAAGVTLHLIRVGG
jgi:tRNA 2-thiouridine synthesizing protein A